MRTDGRPLLAVLSRSPDLLYNFRWRPEAAVEIFPTVVRLLGEIETFFRRLFNKPYDNVILTLENVDNWPRFKKLFDEGKVKADSTGRLRYPHGAPVGRMTISSRDARGMPVYREAADEWFDPESPRAQKFEWP